jgi:hypothetical protein
MGIPETKNPLRRTRGRWKVNTKWNLRIKMGERGQHSSGSELVQVAGPCEPDNKLWVS